MLKKQVPTVPSGRSNHTAELADLRGLIQRTESKLASDIDQTSRDCERNLDQLRQELRVKTATNTGDLTHELWESTERRLLLLSEKIHVVESRMVAGDYGFFEMGEDTI